MSQTLQLAKPMEETLGVAFGVANGYRSTPDTPKTESSSF